MKIAMLITLLALLCTCVGGAHGWAILLDARLDERGNPTNVTQLYTPLSHETLFTDVDFGLPHHRFGAVVTMHGLVYIMGGAMPNAFKGLKTTFMFNPMTNRTQQMADMNRGRYYFAAAAMPDSRQIIACGGYDNSCEQFDTVSNVWTFIEALPGSVSGYQTALTFNNRPYMFGGYTRHGDVNQTVMLGIDGHWKRMADMPVPLDQSAAIEISANTAMLCGGFDNTNSAIETCYIYSAVDDKWTTSAVSLTRPHYGHTLVRHLGRVWCIGGAGNRDPPVQIEVYTESSGWQGFPRNDALAVGDGLTIAAIFT